MASTHGAGSHICFIIPRHILKAIAQSEAASQDSKDIACKTLDHVSQIRSSRAQAQAMSAVHRPRQGIVPSHIFQAIIDSQDATPGAKAQAQHQLDLMEGHKTSHETATSTGSATAFHLFRILYDSHQTSEEPGTKLFYEGHVPDNADPSAKEVYENFGSTFKFYSEVLKRNSIDDKGMNLIGSVHYDDDNGETPGYDNAFYDGTEMCFGDGDPQIFNSFTKSLDITGHELTHGVTAMTAGLPYEHESGALNESISDVFGSIVKQYALKQKAKDADWLIGEGLFRDSTNARALRDMANPGTAYKHNKFIGSDPQPAHMSQYSHSPNTDEGDFGGVHTNSGIPNRAFYLTATSIGEYSWDPAGKIWYAALNDPSLKNVNTKKTFNVFADLTCKYAEEMAGKAGLTAVKNAWTTVGVYNEQQK